MKFSKINMRFLRKQPTLLVFSFFSSYVCHVLCYNSGFFIIYKTLIVRWKEDVLPYYINKVYPTRKQPPTASETCRFALAISDTSNFCK